MVAELGRVAAALPTEAALRRALVGLPALDGNLEAGIVSATRLLKEGTSTIVDVAGRKCETAAAGRELLTVLR